MKNSGWVHVICGPMYSGKTEALIRLVNRAEIAGKVVLLLKPDIDTRTENVTSRNGLSHKSVAIGKGNAEIVYDSYLKYRPDIIAIDEAQFFSTMLPFAVQEMANQGAKVLISGLDRDFMGNAFGPMGDLLVIADEVTKLTSICFVCYNEASLTQRLVNGIPAKADDPLIVVGGINDDKYEARCRKCWELG
jgi:thymidine kinase